ncbi:MAG TPA: tyrosine--tRNA ligase [Chthoniobacterales bacterium]
MEPAESLSLLKQGAAQIISEEELRQKLALNRPLRVKLGVDPTSADIHLGHTVVLRKLRQFQDLGHEAVLIIGDFTAMIGDPSGRSVTRPQLTHDQVMAHAASYRDQALKVLDPVKTRIVFNGEWFQSMAFDEVIRLNSRVTLQQMLQREDFKARLEKQQPISAHEIQYPIMQAWDSVMVRADVELGGTDQLFNILVGRDLQKDENLPQQVVFLLPILAGLDGVQKMSKSLGNHIGVSEPASEIFGKLMSVSDELMAQYYLLLLGRKFSTGLHPMEAKKQLAFEIVATYHSREAAQRALDEWNTRFSEKDLSDIDLPNLGADFWPFEEAYGGDLVTIVCGAYLTCFNVQKSRTEARKLIEQGSVKVDGKKFRDPKATPKLQPGQILRLDKTHAVRIA